VWCFNHDVEADKAIERWERRRKRFNRDNYIVIMCIRSDEMAFKFDKLPIKNKIGFYWKDLGLESVVYMPEWADSRIRSRFMYNFTGLVNRATDDMYGIRAINSIILST